MIIVKHLICISFLVAAGLLTVSSAFGDTQSGRGSSMVGEDDGMMLERASNGLFGWNTPQKNQQVGHGKHANVNTTLDNGGLFGWRKEGPSSE